MRPQPAAEENRTAGMNPLPQPRSPWRLAAVFARPGYRLAVRFLDGLEGEVDLSGLIFSPAAGVFARLADEALFSKVFVELGAVTWPDGPDLAPDAMYRAIKADGVWTP